MSGPAKCKQSIQKRRKEVYFASPAGFESEPVTVRKKKKNKITVRGQKGRIQVGVCSH